METISELHNALPEIHNTVPNVTSLVPPLNMSGKPVVEAIYIISVDNTLVVFIYTQSQPWRVHIFRPLRNFLTPMLCMHSS